MSGGRLLTFEGVEGCGKSTQLLLLARYLQGRSLPFVTTREPGGTSLGERVRELLLDPRAIPTPTAELFLFEAARAQLVTEVIRPALQAGTTVLADRFADSSLAYQGGGRGVAATIIASLNALACAGVVPDRTLVFDLDVEMAFARARRRPTTTADNRRFEDEMLPFHQAVATAYYELAQREPARVRLVDARGAPEEVHERTLAAVVDLFP